MGSFQRKGLLAAAVVVSMAAGVFALGSGDDPEDAIGTPTIERSPELLAFDDASPDSDPAAGERAAPASESDPIIGEREGELQAGPTGDPLASTTTQPATAPGASPAGPPGGLPGAGVAPTSVAPGEPPLAEATPSDSTAAKPVVAAAPGSPSTAAPTTAAPAAAPAPSTTAPPTAASPTTASPAAAAPPAADRSPTVGFSGIDVGDFTNSNANISQSGQDGSFRTVCTVSHFNFDDAIVFPGQRAATHLHMYFGNTLADASSTPASLASSGDASCQGGPLNRSAYWVPAVLDGNGDVRSAQYMLAYYKRAGDEDVVPYPNGLQMVVGNAMAMSPQPGREQPIGAGIDHAWSCGSPITVGNHDTGRLMPDCAPGEFLTLNLIFPRCGDGRLESADNKSHMAYPAYYGGPCPSSHPIRHPQLTYNIHWNNNDTNTGDWYLSSDDHRPMGGMLMPGGTTTHADWIGAWHPDVLDIMTGGCFNADHDCKGGTISPSLRLDEPNIQGFSPSNIYNSGATPTAIPFANFGTGTTYAT